MKLIALDGKNPKPGRNDLCPCGSQKKYKKCCLLRGQQSEFAEELEGSKKGQFNPMTVRKEIQSMMGQMAKIIQEKGMSIEQANEYFVGKKMDDIKAEYEERPRSIHEQATDLAFEAYSQNTAKKRIAMAEKALEMDENCAEAYLLLAGESQDNPILQMIYHEHALVGATENLGEEFFKENAGHFWGIHETRSFMRAKQGLAQNFWELRRQSEAIEHCWEMLELNPNDNQGIRYILFDYLLADNQLAEIPDLLEMYPEESTAHWEYDLALYYFKTKGPDEIATQRQVEKAVKANPFILEYLLTNKDFPENLPDAFALGSRDEAICYCADSILAWMNTPYAINWVEAATEKLPVKSSKKLKSVKPRKSTKDH